jgi:hypothetical protein
MKQTNFFKLYAFLVNSKNGPVSIWANKNPNYVELGTLD